MSNTDIQRKEPVANESLREEWLDGRELLPRFREIGDVTLDLFHRDGRVDDRWLALFPREFELFWRLAQQPGIQVSKQQLLEDVWRLKYEPESNRIAVHVARLRSKLEPFGLAAMIATHPQGGYFLDAPSGPSIFRFSSAE